MQKRITAINRELPPSNEQFLLDFEQLQAQFPDKEQLRAATESVLVTLVVHCSSHAPHSEFLLFSVRSLCSIDYINWDRFLPALLSSVSVSEVPVGQGTQSMPNVSSTVSGASCITSSSNTIPNSSHFQASNPASPLTHIHAMGSPGQGSVDPLASVGHSPVKSSEIPYPSQQTTLKSCSLVKSIGVNWLRQLSCKIILQGIELNLKPATYADIFSHMMNWLVNWDQQQHGGLEEFDGTCAFKSERDTTEWIHSCLDVIWLLVEEDKCRVPFYELLRSDLQFLDNIPDNEALFTMILEIHRRRDMVAMHMQMLDQHLHCPSFATHRLLSQFYPIISGESLINLRPAPLTYPSVLGEPLHGEDLAAMIPKESMDWERALRCLRHALRATPSPDWWRRVLVIAPCYRQQAQQQVSVSGVVFSAEMICEAVIDRIVELLKCSNSETNCWQEWLTFSDILYFLTKNGHIDFLDFVDKLVMRVARGDQKLVRSNHVTWLLTQMIRLEVVTNALNTDPKKVDAIRKIISFQCEERNSDQNLVTPQTILLDLISSSQSLRIWSFNPSNKDCLNPEQIQKGKQIEEWWRPFGKGERALDYANLDDRSLGMFWVLSHTMFQSACEILMSWLNSAGVSELMQPGSIQSNERMMMMRESCPLPMTFLSGLSIHLLLNLSSKIEDALFQGQVIPSISLVETYARILLIAPHSLFRLHFSTLSQRCPTLFSKPGASLLLLEILNYRLIPLYRYNGKIRSLLYDVSKTIASMKGKRGEHRSFRLAENLCMNLILSLRDYFSVKRDPKEPSELTETLNRVCIVSLAILSKTRGIGELENIVYLQPLLEQILATSQHTWSEKTLRHFPPLIRDFLKVRMDKRGQVIQAWQQAETTVINQCTQLLSPQADPTYVMTYINHSFPQHRKYLCAGAWMLMKGHPENINSANLARVLKELSPDEVTSNIYTMVDVLLHHIQIELQHGQLLQDLLFKASANLSFFIWTHELLPLDIVLLALADRDDDPHALRLLVSLLLDRQEFQQRVKVLCLNRGLPEHWLNTGLAKRVELQKALGNHLSGKDRYPPFFDDVAARMLPVIPLIAYRLIENDAVDAADRFLATYSALLMYHPMRFTFVREILAYFYGHLPCKLIVRILQVLDLPKIPFSESFPQHIGSSNPAVCPPADYFSALLMGLVNNVMPPLSNKAKTGFGGDASAAHARTASNKAQSSVQSLPINITENQKAFYQIQDPGTYPQLVLETAVIEILSLPVTASQIVSAFVQIVVHVQPVLTQSSYGAQIMPNVVGQGAGLPTSPSGGSTDSMNTSRSNPASGSNTTYFASKTGYANQSFSCLMVQACGLLLAQLPPDFHIQLYVEASRIIKECWWLTDAAKSSRELDSAVGYALWDPTWAAQDNTSTAIGNTVALLHAFFGNLPQEWLEGTQTVIKQLRPVNSIALLRIAFRIMGPLLPRLASTRPLFMKTLALLFNVMADVFGRNSQPTSLTEVKDISDIIDFIQHAVLYEGQGPVQGGSRPRLDTMTLCGKMIELLRPDLQHLFCHLRPDPKTSIYAATHPKLVQSTT